MVDMNLSDDTKTNGFEGELYAETDEITRAELDGHGGCIINEMNERLEEIMDRAPSDSSAELHVRKSESGYKGTLKVNSQQRRFVGGGSGPDIMDVFEKVVDEVQDQISEWSKGRNVTADDITY